MAGDVLLKKIDRTLVRNTEVIARNADVIARNTEVLERVTSRLDRDEEREREHRQFLDALTKRHVGITQQLVGSITKLQAEIADQRAQIQANTKALLRVLDRLDPQQG